MYEEVIHGFQIYADDTENNEVSEETTEETTEESEEELTTENTEEVTTEKIVVELSTEDLDIEYLTTENQVVDTRLYMSVPVQGADSNDIFSMLLSIRNILLVFMIFFIFFKVKNIIHTTLSKLFNKGK